MTTQLWLAALILGILAGFSVGWLVGWRDKRRHTSERLMEQIEAMK